MKIAVLGAGGMRLPLLYQALATRSPALRLERLALMDIDAGRLDLMLGVTRAMAETPPGLHVEATTGLEAALEGASFVITTFRVGDMTGRVADERIPLAHGLLGQETTGAGGFAMAMRTLPVLHDVIEHMRRLCPQAWLVNFANPSGLLAQAARRAGWERSLGICDAPSTMLHLAARLLDVPAGEVYLDYFGLNHLGWVRRVLHRGEDYLPTFLSMIRAAGGFPGLPFEPDLLLELRMIPNEYLKYYYYARQTVEALRAATQTRGEFLLELNDSVRRDLADLLARGEAQAAVERYRAYLHRRGETYQDGMAEPAAFPSSIQAGDGGGYADVPLDVIDALAGGGQRLLIVNAPNQGAVEGMAADDVVEIPMLVRADGLQPMAVGPIPDHALGLMLRVKAYERLTIEAVAEASRSKALLALTLHPLVADAARARLLLEEMERAHASTFPRLQ